MSRIDEPWTGKLIVLRNAYHGTEITIETEYGGISKRKARSCREALCPVRSCQCADIWGLGLQGPQSAPDGKPVTFYRWPDGSWQITLAETLRRSSR